MNINCVKVGYLRTNCYILEKDGKVLVVDPADEYLKIKEVIGDNEVANKTVTYRKHGTTEQVTVSVSELVDLIKSSKGGSNNA